MGTVDYQSRHHEIDFMLTPYYGISQLNFTTAQQTFSLEYKKTILKTERQNKKTTGLTPLAVRKKLIGYPIIAFSDPEMPIAAVDSPRLSIDAEGFVSNSDGS